MPYPYFSSKYADMYPSIQVIGNWYSFLNMNRRWDKRRLRRLCSFLQVNELELGAILNVGPGYFMRDTVRKDFIKGPLALLLTMLEAHVLSDFLEDVPEKVLPDGVFKKWSHKKSSKSTDAPPSD